MTRAEKVAEAQRLRRQGLYVREIAERMAVARSTAQAWLNDPDLSKQRARRQTYSQPCIDCGASTDGSGGFTGRRERCESCKQRHQHETRHWTPERVVAALQEWAAGLGRPPSATEALVGGAPISCTIVQREFGSWNAGIAAAGFEPLPVGRRRNEHTRTAA